LLVVICN